MRKSVSFHEEDPHVVFEYPPASDSSEDGYPSDDNEQFCQNIDYLKYAGIYLSLNFSKTGSHVHNFYHEYYIKITTYVRQYIVFFFLHNFRKN